MLQQRMLKDNPLLLRPLGQIIIIDVEDGELEVDLARVLGKGVVVKDHVLDAFVGLVEEFRLEFETAGHVAGDFVAGGGRGEGLEFCLGGRFEGCAAVVDALLFAGAEVSWVGVVDCIENLHTVRLSSRHTADEGLDG